jgi:hypothetical protein
MTDFATIHLGTPDIPAGTTIADYRRSRPRRLAWWRLPHRQERTANDGLDDLSLAGQVARKDALHGALCDPGRFALVGLVSLFVLSSPLSVEAWALFTGAGLSVLLLNVLFRLGVQGDLERDREDAARAYFDDHGTWPDEETRPAGRRSSLPEGVVMPQPESDPRTRA